MCVSGEEDDIPQEKSVLDDGDNQLWDPRDDSSDTGEPDAACTTCLRMHSLDHCGRMPRPPLLPLLVVACRQQLVVVKYDTSDTRYGPWLQVSLRCFHCPQRLVLSRREKAVVSAGRIDRSIPMFVALVRGLGYHARSLVGSALIHG